MSGWPTDADWAALNKSTNGRLSRVTVPKLDGAEGKELLEQSLLRWRRTGG